MLVTFLVLAACLSLLLFSVLLTLYRKSQNKTTVPGLEPSDSLKGNLSDIQDAGGFAPFLQLLHDKFGPVASFWFGTEYYVSAASADTLKPLMQLFDRPVGSFEFLRHAIGNHAIHLSNGTKARGRHGAFAESLSVRKVGLTISQITEICNELGVTWSRLPDDEHIHPATYMYALSIKMLAKVQFGSPCFDDDAEINKLYKVCSAVSDQLVFGFDGLNDDERKMEERDKNVSDLHDMMTKVLSFHKSARERGDGSSSSSSSPLLKAILDHSPAEETARHSDVTSQELGDIVALLVGGFRTVGSGLAWFVYYMTLYPEIQDKIYDELVDVLGASDPDESAIKKLSYTRQVVDETFRLVRLVPFAARVSSDEEIRVGGHVLPPAVPVVFALHVALHDPDVFAEPEKFDPDRFSGESRPDLAFSPFGFGLRRCPGYNLAYAEIMVAIAVLLRRFKVVPAGGAKDFSVRPEFGFVTMPDRDFWISVEKR